MASGKASVIKVDILGDSSDLAKATGKAETAVAKLNTKIEKETKSSTEAMETFSRKSKAAVRDLDDKVVSSGNAMPGKMDKFGRAAHNTGNAVKAGLAIAAYAVSSFVADGVRDIMHWDELNAQTRTTVLSTGGAANTSAKHINTYANAIEKLTGVEAESVQEGANVLLGFQKIRNETGAGNDILDQSMATATDMAKKMGTDPAAAAKLLGKALQDPVKGMMGLKKAGVFLSDGQKLLIKTMMENGDVLGAQKIILEETNKVVGGSATAWGETMPGQVAKAQNAYGDLKEELAESLMPTLLTVAETLKVTIPQAIDAFKAKWKEWQPTIKENVADFKQGWSDFQEGVDSFKAGYKEIDDNLTAGGVVIWGWVQNFRTGCDTIWLAWTTFKDNFKAGYKEIDDSITAGGLVLWGYVQNFQTGVATIQQHVTTFKDNFKAGFKEIDDAVHGAWTTISELPGKVLGLAASMLDAGLSIGKSLMDGVGQGLSSAVGFAGDLASGVVAKIKEGINTMINALNDVLPDKIGTGRFSVDMPQVPNIKAMGGPASGLVSVGERGPERVLLPRGSRVVPNHATGGGGITVNVSNPRATPGEIAAALAWTLKTSGR